MNHAFLSDRQTTCLLTTILEKGHENQEFFRLGCAACGRPKSTEPQHVSCAACPERCGTRLFVRGGGQWRPLFHFVLSMERLSTGISTFLKRSLRQWTEDQPQQQAFALGDRRWNLGMDRSMVNQFNQSIIPVMCYKGRR